MTQNNQQKLNAPKDLVKLNLDKGLTEDDYLMLLTLYKLRSYSGFEQPVRNFIEGLLNEWKIPYINLNGNLVGLNHDGAPIISAHMDMVNTDRNHLGPKEDSIPNAIFTVDDDTNIKIYRPLDNGDVRQTSLGADDKNGIWIALLLLKRGVNINFIFSHGEECGCVGIKQVVADAEIAQKIEKCAYSLVIDRRNKDDIIGYGNDYCLALDDRLQKFAKDCGYGYTCAQGLCSDANHISLLVETVNLSCGYYNAHSPSEYTNLSELVYCYNFVSQVISKFQFSSVSGERMRKFKKASKPYKTEAEIKKEQEEAARKEEAEKNRTYGSASKSESYYNNGRFSYNNSRSFYGQSQSKKDGGINEATGTKEVKRWWEAEEEDDDNFFKDVDETTPLDIEVRSVADAKARGEIVSAFDVMICPYCGEQVFASMDDMHVIGDDLDAYDQLRDAEMVEYFCECGEVFTCKDVVTQRDMINGDCY